MKTTTRAQKFLLSQWLLYKLDSPSTSDPMVSYLCVLTAL